MSEAGTPIAQQSDPQSSHSPDLDLLMAYFRDAGVMGFPKMTLLARDHEPVVLEGNGRVEFPSPDKMILHMTGQPVDLRHTLFAINRLRDNPYDTLNHSWRSIARSGLFQTRRTCRECQTDQRQAANALGRPAQAA